MADGSIAQVLDTFGGISFARSGWKRVQGPNDNTDCRLACANYKLAKTPGRV